MKDVILHPEARQEVLHEEAYYEAKDEGLGDEFSSTLTEVLEAIRLHLKRCRRRLGPCLRFIFDRFPFSAVYEELDDQIFVYAIMHHSREPFYWLHRRTPQE